MNTQESSWLYSDRELTKKLTNEQVDKWWNNRPLKPLYFWDGNNGDKHFLVGRLENSVLGVNLSQCHLFESGLGRGYKNVNAVAEKMNEVSWDGQKVVAFLHDIMEYHW